VFCAAWLGVKTQQSLQDTVGLVVQERSGKVTRNGAQAAGRSVQSLPPPPLLSNRVRDEANLFQTREHAIYPLLYKSHSFLCFLVKFNSFKNFFDCRYPFDNLNKLLLPALQLSIQHTLLPFLPQGLSLTITETARFAKCPPTVGTLEANISAITNSVLWRLSATSGSVIESSESSRQNDGQG
jgi:hypothetical protein